MAIRTPVCAIQQPLEVEARQLVLRLLADIGGEGRNRAGIVGFELGEGIQVSLGGGVVILLGAQRLESAQRFGLAAQHQIADRPAAEAIDLAGQRRADANTGAELLIGGFQPRRDIDGVAIGGVIEETIAAEIADDRRSGMDADPGDAERNASSPASAGGKLCANSSRSNAQATARAA